MHSIENGVDLLSHVAFAFEVDIIISHHVKYIIYHLYIYFSFCYFTYYYFFHKLVDSLSVFAYCYHPLDPNGNITVTFDTHKCTYDGYVVSVLNQFNWFVSLFATYIHVTYRFHEVGNDNLSTHTK